MGYRRDVSAPPVSDLAHAPVEVRRSKRRKRTVQAYIRDDTVIVLLPARMTKAEEKYWVVVMVDRLQRQEQRRRRRADAGDADLFARARELSARYLDGRAHPAEVRWVDNQNDRWGSCTPANGSIRLSSRLRELPQWVADYVLLHELAHLLEPGHGPEFWRLLDSYPKTERARGYLEGVLAAPTFAAQPPEDGPDPGLEREPGSTGGGPDPAADHCTAPGSESVPGPDSGRSPTLVAAGPPGPDPGWEGPLALDPGLGCAPALAGAAGSGAGLERPSPPDPDPERSPTPDAGGSPGPDPGVEVAGPGAGLESPPGADAGRQEPRPAAGTGVGPQGAQGTEEPRPAAGREEPRRTSGQDALW